MFFTLGHNGREEFGEIGEMDADMFGTLLYLYVSGRKILILWQDLVGTSHY